MLGVWARYMDWKVGQKVGITLLGNGVDPYVNKYIYEIMVFTGMRPNAGTTSKVSCIIASESTRTDTIELKDSKRKLFNRAGIDSFILLLDK